MSVNIMSTLCCKKRTLNQCHNVQIVGFLSSVDGICAVTKKELVTLSLRLHPPKSPQIHSLSVAELQPTALPPLRYTN